jgi:thymidylate synthase (FAD)
MKVIKHKSEEVFVDLLEGCDSWEIKIGEHGLVGLLDIMPRLVPAGRTADAAIVQAARTSTGKGLKSVEEDRALIRYMFSHAHSSPFESCEFTFHHVLPIFVARQLVRHRTASLNEFSARYADVKDRFWIPEPQQLRSQSMINKQSTDGSVDLVAASDFIASLELASADAMAEYQKALKGGIGRELARTILPINLFTEWRWKIDLGNLLKFLGLRQDKHAQAEIRVYADAMYELLKPLVPAALEAYDDYHPNRGAMLMSRMDIEGMTAGSETLSELFPSDRELTEFRDKVARLGNGYAQSRADLILRERAGKQVKK